MTQTLKLSIRNASLNLRIVRLEPWGREFPLKLDEKLELTSQAKSAQACFRLMESDNRTQVFAEGCFDVTVLKDGATHNLDLEANAGTSKPELLPTLSKGGPTRGRDLDI
jgi:hypothetical protein